MQRGFALLMGVVSRNDDDRFELLIMSVVFSYDFRFINHSKLRVSLFFKSSLKHYYNHTLLSNNFRV